MRQPKKTARQAGIAVIICVIVCLFPLPRKIDLTLPGIQCRNGDTAYAEEVTVSVKGMYRQYLLKNDVFDGTVTVSCYDFTMDSDTGQLIFADGCASLIYVKFTNGVPKPQILGTILCAPNFGRLLICVSEPVYADANSYSSEGGLFISAPAQNRGQAVDIARALARHSSWLSQATWQ